MACINHFSRSDISTLFVICNTAFPHNDNLCRPNGRFAPSHQHRHGLEAECPPCALVSL